jgi:cellulose synthase/poly-beta-1,6-N-acetylglucosamine synthase-like glycosyltransferase
MTPEGTAFAKRRYRYGFDEGVAAQDREPSAPSADGQPLGPASPPPATGGQEGVALTASGPSTTNAGAPVLHVKQFSRGMVERASRYGPVISSMAPHRRLRRSTFSPILSPTERVIISFVSLMWVICLVDFWIWWLEPVHQTSAYGSILYGIVLTYLTCYPVFFVVVVNRLQIVSRRLSMPRLRVGFIVTRAPSEPWSVAQATLTAMLNQDFPLPYDVWLADEKPTPEILEWCSANGVLVSTRDGVAEYHRLTWPRRTKCKEGNLAFFYDHWGYRSYDVVAQLDCDHKPSPTYLAEIIRPFADPAVGYVAAPSVCDTNAAESWSARGRLYREATFHGAFQLGHSAGWAPACIGSHYAVRTAALRDIGGIGPELAEDFSTTFLLNSAGWHGAFAIDAEAHGDGPNTFAAMLTQEFQWSKSLTVLLLKVVPYNFGCLGWAHRFRFIYAVFYYILVTVSMVTGILLAPIAAMTGRPWMEVNYIAFLLHWWLLSIWMILLVVLLKRCALLRPGNAPIISWESWLYMLVRWPYVAWGVWSAIMYSINPKPDTFRVTPKGPGELEPLPMKVMAPYIFITLLCSAAAITGEYTNNAAGYVLLSIGGAFTYSIICFLVPRLHAWEMTLRVGIYPLRALRKTSLMPYAIGLATALPATYAAIHYPAYAEHVFHWNWHMIHANWSWHSLF